MESYFAFFIALVVVVALAMGLAAYNNRADEPVARVDKQKRKGERKGEKKGERKEKKEKKSDDKKKKKNEAPITFIWDGKEENDDESMIELLRGTSELRAREWKSKEIDEKKARASAIINQTTEKPTKAKGSKKEKEEEEEFEYVLMKRKKVDEKSKGKKKAKEVVPVIEGEATNAPSDNATPEAEKGKGKKKSQLFYKKNLIKSLRDAAEAEKSAKQQEEDEKAQSKGKKKEGANNEEAEPAKDDRKDKPAKSKDTESNVNANQTVGPRQAPKPQREPREFREPREAPPPPPRPLGGHFESASLDDMLSAISSHYGPKPKQNFAKLPQSVLDRLLQLLTLKDIIVLSKVNHFLNKACNDKLLWKNLYEKDFGIKRNPNSKKKFKNMYRDEYLKSKGKVPNTK